MTAARCALASAFSPFSSHHSASCQCACGRIGHSLAAGTITRQLSPWPRGRSDNLQPPPAAFATHRRRGPVPSRPCTAGWSGAAPARSPRCLCRSTCIPCISHQDASRMCEGRRGPPRGGRLIRANSSGVGESPRHRRQEPAQDQRPSATSQPPIARSQSQAQARLAQSSQTVPTAAKPTSRSCDPIGPSNPDASTSRSLHSFLV